MPESTLADIVAAADRRIESMSVLCQMLFGQAKQSHGELQKIKLALASARTQEEQRPVVPSVIGPEMLVG